MNRYLKVHRGDDYRYYRVFDYHGDCPTYGILRIRVADCDMAVIQFFNEISQIDLRMNKLTKAEWETYQAFELFPVLYPYYEETHIEMDYSTRATSRVTTFKVRFRDY